MSESLTVLHTYAELLAASGGDPIVRFEVGEELLAPPLRLRDGVLFRRETQLGFAGAVALGPADDLATLLRSPWRSIPGWAAERSLTVPRAARALLVELGGRGIGEWDWYAVERHALARRRLPAGLSLGEVDRSEAVAFVEIHHSARWITPEPTAERWLGLRDASGALVAVGLASATPSGDTRLTSITVDRASRGQGLGWAITQALAEHGLRQTKAVVLGVEADNTVGKSLYTAMGFQLAHEFASGTLVRDGIPG